MLDELRHLRPFPGEYVVKGSVCREAAFDVAASVTALAGEVAEQRIGRCRGRVGVGYHVTACVRGLREEGAYRGPGHGRRTGLDHCARGAEVGYRAIEHIQRLGGHLRARHVRVHQTQTRVLERIIAQQRESASRPRCRERQAIRSIRTCDRVEQEGRVGHGARERSMRVEIRPGGDHSRARHQSECRLHPDDAAELRRDAIGTAVVRTKCGEGDATRDRNGRARARPTGRSCSGWIVRIPHLAGERTGAIASVRKIVGDRRAEHDGTCGAQARHLDRVATKRRSEQPRPLGARRRCGKPGHIVDRLRKHRDAVERPAQCAALRTRVGSTRLVERCGGQLVDRVQCAVPRRAPFECAAGDVNGGPISACSPRLVFHDRAGERIGEPLGPANERNGEQRAQAGKSIASGQ